MSEILPLWSEASDIDKEQLRNFVLENLQKQGFEIKDGRLLITSISKETIRNIYAHYRETIIRKSKPKLEKYEDYFLKTYFAGGEEIIPEQMKPELVEVSKGTEYDLLFKYASLYWSVPVPAGTGRRLRFLVMDKSNGKLIGLIGLDDPTYDLKAREQWIGWNYQVKGERIGYIMNAYVLGAIPPYNRLLCGKLVAMLVVSNEIRETFRQKYRGKKSLIRGREHDGNLALITTMSALGRSSIYNRLKYHDRLLYIPIGYTSGYGDFQFSGEVWSHLLKMFNKETENISRRPLGYKMGYKKKLQVIRKMMELLNLPRELVNHGIKREIFAVPLASNAREFLRGETDSLDYYNISTEDISNWFKHRWLLPRLSRDKSYLSFTPQEIKIWK